MLAPAVLSFTAVAFEGASLAVLIPFLTGILTSNWQMLQEVPGYAVVIALIPGLAERSSHLVIALASVIVGGILLKNTLLYAANVSVTRLVKHATHNLRQLVFERCLSYGKLFFDRSSVGHLGQVLMNYTSQVTSPITQVHQMITMIFSLALYLALMAFISWPLALFTILVLPLMNLALARLIARVKYHSLIQTKSINDLGKRAYNILSSIPLVKLYDNDQQERERFAAISYKVAHLDYKIINAQNLVAPLQEGMALLTMLAVMGMVAWLASRGRTIAPGSFVVFFYLVLHTVTTYGRLHRFQGTLAKAAGPIEEIRQILNDTDKHVVPDGAKHFRGLTQELVFDHLRFAYIDDVPVLRDVSFRVPAGGVVALVGPTGVGKTTIVSLLLRMYDCPSQSIFVDGQDIRDFTAASLRGGIAFVSQDAWLFNDTLWANVTYGLPKPSEEEVIDALARSQLLEFVQRLPQGIDTEIGDRGVKLSGGEKQRLSIARALLKKADIVIFDEPTSALDARTEKLVQIAMQEAVDGRTVLIIAHRLATVQHADSIVVLEDGKVVEQGTWHELYAHHEGLFRTFWDAQAIRA